jgi:hypothetical protein
MTKLKLEIIIPMAVAVAGLLFLTQAGAATFVGVVLLMVGKDMRDDIRRANLKERK